MYETGHAGHIQEDFDLAAANETSNNILLRSITHHQVKKKKSIMIYLIHQKGHVNNY